MNKMSRRDVMKKIRFVSLLLCAAMLLGSCGTSDNVSEHTVTDTSAPESAQTSAGSAQALENDDPVTTTEAEPPEPADTRTPWEKLSDITEEVSDNIRVFRLPVENPGSSSQVSGGAVTVAELFSYDAEEFGIVRIDLNKGTIKKRIAGIDKEYAGYTEAYTLNGYSVTFDTYYSELTVYDDELNEVDRRKVSGIPNGFTHQLSDKKIMITSYGSERVAYAEISDEGKITVRETDITLGGNLTYSEVENVVGEGKLILMCRRGNFEDEYYDYVRVLYNIEDESYKMLYFRDDTNYSVTLGDNIILLGSENELDVYSPQNPNGKHTFVLNEGEHPLYSYYGCRYLYAAGSYEDKVIISAYSVDTGECVGSAEMEGTDYPYISKICEFEDYIIVSGYIKDNKYEVFAVKLGEGSKKEEYSMLESPDYNFLVTDTAEKIRRKYNVNVHYGEDAVKYYSGYVVVSETDDKVIYKGMQTLSSFLEKFPEGFIQEICDSNNGSLDIYFTGTILEGDSDNSICNAAGVTFFGDGSQFVVVDIRQFGFDRTLAHEFMHVIENAVYIKSYAAMLENSDAQYEYFRRFEMLNPPDFEYYYDYTDDYGNTMGYSDFEYTSQSFYETGDAENVYFVDGYSKTYPSEDMAVIFENIFMSYKEELQPYFSSTHLKLKAAYICDVIRETFDCITPETSVIWENSVDTEYTIEYFTENYDYDISEYAVG